VFPDLLMSATVRLCILALCYLATGISLTIHVRSERPQAVKPHVAKEKPWLTPRAHYILMDPACVREYGHPSVGTHRSLTPHPRRGHWRRLPEGYRKERTWVRDTFVGGREWSSEGKAYKIVDLSERARNNG